MNALSKLTLALVMTAASAIACAQDSHAGHGATPAGQEAPAAVELTDGEVRKIDREAGKITLRHGEIKNLNMAAMTMVLRVKDAAMLEQVQVGDRIRFAADRVNGAVTVVRWEKAQ